MPCFPERHLIVGGYLFLSLFYAFPNSMLAHSSEAEALSVPIRHTPFYTHVFLGELKRKDVFANQDKADEINDYIYLSSYYLQVIDNYSGDNIAIQSEIPFSPLGYLMDDHKFWNDPDGPLFFELGHRYLIMLRMSSSSEKLTNLSWNDWQWIKVIDIDESADHMKSKNDIPAVVKSENNQWEKRGVVLFYNDLVALNDEVDELSDKIVRGEWQKRDMLMRYGRPLSGWSDCGGASYVVYPCIVDDSSLAHPNIRRTQTGVELSYLNKRVHFLLFGMIDNVITRLIVSNTDKNRVMDGQ